MPFNPQKEEDFLLNEYFIQWVIHPDKESDRFWTKWMKDNPDKAPILRRAKEGILSFKPVTYTMDESVNEQILNKVLIHHQKKGTEKSGGKRNFLSKLPTIQVAASVIILSFFLAGLVYLFSLSQHKEAVPSPVWVSKTSRPGAKMSFQLPDGSKVKLNASSTLEFPTEFSDSIREVRITGEAFFEINHREDHPFVVHSGELKVKVLGTSFDVRNYPEDTNLMVAVANGKVSIHTHEGFSEVLSPMEMVIYSKENKSLIKEAFDPALIFGWKDGVLQFKNSRFPEVFKTLERWYGVEFSISEDVRFKGGFNGKFENESLENVLTGISFSEGFKFQINDKNVRIYH